MCNKLEWKIVDIKFVAIEDVSLSVKFNNSFNVFVSEKCFIL
jgi:hypothetical protein